MRHNWTTIGELSVGDQVYDHDGNLTTVVAKSEVFYRDTYKVTMSDGEEILACDKHLWNVATQRDRDNYQRTSPEWKAKRRANRPSRAKSREQSVAEGIAQGDLRGRSDGNSESSKHSNSKRAAEARELEVRPSIWDYTRTVTTTELKSLITSETRKLGIPRGGAIAGTGAWMSLIPAYTLGYWLGDGISATGDICVGEEDYQALLEELRLEGWKVVKETAQLKPSGNYLYTVKVVNSDGVPLKRLLQYEGLLNNKHVPEWIINAPYADRQAFLGGFFDSDGHVDERGRIQFCLAREDMVRDVHAIVWSMGVPATSIKHKKTRNQIQGFLGDAWRFEISQCPEYLFRFPRKRDRLREATKGKRQYTNYRYISSVEKVDSVPTQCIQVDNPRGLFRVGRTNLVTHNSIALLMAALQYVEHPKYNALILRRTFKDLSQPGALIDIAMEWLKPTDARWNEQKKQWKFPSGAILQFGHMESENDKTNYQGAAYQFVGYDELTQFTEPMYTYLFSRMRKQNTTDLPMRMRGAGNPGGIGHEWVKRRFIDPPDPETMTESEIARRENRIFIPSGLKDNPHLDQEDYLESMEELDSVTRAQLMNGDWDVSADGNMFKKEWFDNRVISEVPPDVQLSRKTRYWDLASTDEAKTIKEKGDADYTASVLQALGSDGNVYVLEITRDRLSPAGVEKLIRSVAERDGRTGTAIWMEQEPGSSGVNTIHTYRKLLLGFNFRGDRPTGNKIERARTASAACENGLVYIVRGSKTNDFLNELQSFPVGAHDDMVDAFSAGLLKISESAHIGRPKGPRVRKAKRSIWG